uniref:Uncharacterized protein n=1 Tax=Anguilla anguilla TaxID=7936 RepID=A0A0E9SBE0_ANGAN
MFRTTFGSAVDILFSYYVESMLLIVQCSVNLENVMYLNGS